MTKELDERIQQEFIEFEIIDDEFFKCLCLYETCPYLSADGKKHLAEYYEYNINEDALKEITKEEYQAYKERGAWSNLVLNKQHIEKMIDNAKNTSKISFSEVTKIKNE